MERFPRPELATRIASTLDGRELFGDGLNGLFLAAPRRTGKSTFLRKDLAPELAGRGYSVIYVDLWSAPRIDPADMIDSAIAQAISDKLGAVAKATKAAGVEEPNLAGIMKIDTTRIGRHDGTTLTEALRALREASRGAVVLMVDEAQHALTSTAGEQTMMALKAARDTLNGPDDGQLLLVMTGSDRDKLLRLVNGNAAPFFGSAIRDLPLLGKDFVAFVGSLVEADRPELAPVDTEALAMAFGQFGHRPQLLELAINEALSPLSGSTERFEGAVLRTAGRQRADEEAALRSDFIGSRPLERAVTWRMLDMGRRFRPFDAEAKAFYARALERLGAGGEKVTTARVQSALNSLRDRSPPVAWKSARGEYAIDDASMHQWYERLVEAGRWPPTIEAPER